MLVQDEEVAGGRAVERADDEAQIELPDDFQFLELALFEGLPHPSIR